MTQSALQLFTASSGKLSAKVATANGVRHLHSTVKPEAEADLYNSLEWYGDIIVFAGIGLGYHLNKAILTLPPSALCVVLDFYEECIHHARESTFITIPNKTVFISSSDTKENHQCFDSIVKTEVGKTIQIVKHPASFDCNRQFYENEINKISFLLFGNNKTAFHVPSNKGLLFFGDFFLEEEIKRAIALQGLTPVVFAYKKHLYPQDYESTLNKIIQQEKPDFILSVNMKGFDSTGEIGRIAKRMSIPILVWFVDDPHPILLNQQSPDYSDMIAFCWEKTYLTFLKESGFSRVSYLPLACDPSMFTYIPGQTIVTQLGFVGTSMLDDFAGKIKGKFLWSDSLQPLVQTATQEILSDPAFDIHTTVVSLSRKTGVKLPFSDTKNLTWLCSYIIHTASMEKRKAVVENLLPLGIELFGDPQGWKTLFGENIKAHPNLDYRHELAAIYHQTKVSINSTSCQMPTAVNQRVFDIPMTGGFVLSDNQKDLFELFEENEIAVYHSAGDLVEKAKYFISHESKRLKISERARNKILQKHTYSHRMTTIFSSLSKFTSIQ